MGKVYNTGNLPGSTAELLSQTPPNFVEKNYWLKETQDKVDADWDYRPNRAVLEEEDSLGANTFSALEVVVQSVKSDTGTVISDDWRRLVFRDTRYQCPLGIKFRFSYIFDITEPTENKSIWLASNRNTASPTGSIVVVRCNGTLGSTYLDSNGSTQYHYEPAIQTKDLKTVNLFYNETAVGQQAALIAIVQHNEFTRNYYVNQRFVVGYDRIYRIKALSKFASNRTFDPEDLGTIIIYFEIVETSEYDNFDTRIAYNQKETVQITESGATGNYTLQLKEPVPVPENLTTQVTFDPVLYNGTVVEMVPMTISYALYNAAIPPSPIAQTITDKYIIYTYIGGGTGGNSFALERLHFYAASSLIVNITVEAAHSPTGTDISMEFNLSLRGL